jgi:hypothetical protein
MSLLQLMSTGRSWVRITDGEPRYQVTRQKLLPRFNSKKNPFRATAQPAAAPATVAQPIAAKPVSHPAGGSKIRGWLARMTAKLGSLFARPPKPVKAAIPAFSKTSLQGELSLDHVKVMRNDLSDTDLEIVTLQPKTPAVSAGQDKLRLEPLSPDASGRFRLGLQRAVWTMPGRGRRAMGTALIRVSTRFFGADKH